MTIVFLGFIITYNYGVVDKTIWLENFSDTQKYKKHLKAEHFL